MSLKPPKKSDLGKSWMKNRRDKARMIQPEYHLIASEGTETEPQYFGAIQRIINSKYRDRIQLKVEGIGDNTVNLLMKARQYVQNNGIVFKHVWIVYDTDDFPAENIDMVAQLCEEYSAQGETIYHAVWSNQCVELWYLLHFMYMDTDIDRSRYWPKLSDWLKNIGAGGYEKNRPDMYIYEAFRIDFRDNLELRMGLCMHMVPLLARIKSGMRMKNPILQDIKREYPLAYEMATQACSVLRNVSPNPIKEDEIGYIAVSFALALERQKAKERAPKNILIVCASGKGSAQLLAYRYQQKFGKNLGQVQTCDVIGLRSVNFSKIDYVFSTVPIPIYVPVPIRQIQFFPTEKELTQMKKLLMQGKKGTVEEYFSPELFLPHLNCETREQVLEQMCRFVCGKKKLPDDFFQLVKKRESLAATSFGGLVAMPHPWKAVSKDTFVCLAILDKPVQWGEAKVQVVFLVSIADDATAKLQKFYQVVAQLMVDEACICKLIAERRFEVLLGLLRQKEQGLEEQENG